MALAENSNRRRFIPVRAIQSRDHFWWELPLIMALGATVGVMVLGIIVVSHGAVLPVIAGVGGAVLLGHGGAGAALGVGIGLFGAGSALLGASVGFAAKKVENLFGRFFKPKAQTPVNDSVVSVPSTTTALRSKLGSQLSSPVQVTGYGAAMLDDANENKSAGQVMDAAKDEIIAADVNQRSSSPRCR